jgi:AsmA-like C-terminal region
VLKKLLIVLLVIGLVVVFLVARDWDSPELGQAVLDKVGSATGVELKAEGFRLNLLKGLVLDNVEGKSSGDGRNLSFTLDRLVFEHRVLPLLSGTVAIERILFEKPRFELVQTEAAGSTSEPAASEETEGGETGAGSGSGGSGDGGLALDVKQIRISDGTLSVKNDKGEEKTRVQGLDFEMDNVTFDPSRSSLAGLAAEGMLSIREMTFDTMVLTDTEGTFELKDARFVVPELSFTTPHGNFVADTKLDFNPVPFTYEMTAKGDPLDLNGMVGAEEGFGKATVALEAKGAGPETKDLTASGQIQLAEGEFPAVPMFTRIDDAVGKKLLAGSSYKATKMSFELANDRVELAPFRFDSGDARLDLKGQMNLSGPIDFDLSLATPREGITIEGLAGGMLDLLADKEGWVPIPMSITGTMEEPKVRPDAKALASQAGQGAKREATEKATDAVKGLLNRKKKD